MQGLAISRDSILGKDYVVDATPTEGSDNLITSGAVYTAIEDAGSSPFVATYGTTTSAEIESAYQEGKEIHLEYQHESSGIFDSSFAYQSSVFYRNSENDVGWLISSVTEDSEFFSFIRCHNNNWEIVDSFNPATLRKSASNAVGGVVASGYSSRSSWVGASMSSLVYAEEFDAWIGTLRTIDSDNPNMKLVASIDNGATWGGIDITDSGDALFTHVATSSFEDWWSASSTPCVYAISDSKIYVSTDPLTGTWDVDRNTPMIGHVSCVTSGKTVDEFANSSTGYVIAFNGQSDYSYAYRLGVESEVWQEYDNLPVAADWSAVICDPHNGRSIVIAKDSDTAMYSDYTGVGGFTVTTLPESQAWCSLAYGDGKIIAIAENSTTAAISYDHGETWSSLDISNYGDDSISIYPDPINWSSITYGHGKWIIVGKDMDVSLVSVDTKTWYTIDFGYLTSNDNKVVYGNKQFIQYSTGNVVNIYSSTEQKVILSDVDKMIEASIPGTIEQAREYMHSRTFSYTGDGDTTELTIELPNDFVKGSTSMFLITVDSTSDTAAGMTFIICNDLGVTSHFSLAYQIYPTGTGTTNTKMSIATDPVTTVTSEYLVLNLNKLIAGRLNSQGVTYFVTCF